MTKTTIAKVQKWMLLGHILMLVFGLAGLLLVLPNSDFILNLSAIGKKAFTWSMGGGGAVYMILGTVAVAIFAYRTIGIWHWLSFMIPAIAISLGSELLGTGTGFPFGHYHYLSGLGIKIAERVPFTIPLSWFYVAFSGYIIALVGLKKAGVKKGLREVGAIALGAVILTAWDFALDPAMSQTAVPFWIWEQPGGFFGMPYQNFAGWLATGVLFMSVATLLWKVKPLTLPKTQELGLPLAVYLSNFAFGAIICLEAGIYLPVFLGTLLGVVPITILYFMAKIQGMDGENSLDPLPEEDNPKLAGALRK